MNLQQKLCLQNHVLCNANCNGQAQISAGKLSKYLNTIWSSSFKFNKYNKLSRILEHFHLTELDVNVTLKIIECVELSNMKYMSEVDATA